MENKDFELSICVKCLIRVRQIKPMLFPLVESFSDYYPSIQDYKNHEGMINRSAEDYSSVRAFNRKRTVLMRTLEARICLLIPNNIWIGVPSLLVRVKYNTHLSEKEQFLKIERIGD